MSAFVTLDLFEYGVAAFCGLLRHLESRRNPNIRDHTFVFYDPISMDCIGAVAEKAVAKHLGRPWGAHVNKLNGEPDIWPDIEVRFNNQDSGPLYLRPPKIYPDRKYFLVRGRFPTFEIVGWIPGAEGMQDCYWGDPGGKGRPCYIIPAAKLHEPPPAFAYDDKDAQRLADFWPKGA